MNKVFVKLGIRISDDVAKIYHNDFSSNRRIVFKVNNRNVEIRLHTEDHMVSNHSRLLEIQRNNPLVQMVRSGMIIIGDEAIYGGLLLFCYGDVGWASMKIGQIAYMEHDPDRYFRISPQDLLENDKCG